MSDFVHDEGKGRIFQNKEARGKSPGWTGKATIGGIEYRVAAWFNPSGRPGGSDNFGLTFTDLAEWEANAPDRSARHQGSFEDSPAPSSSPEVIDDFDNEIPF